VTIIGGLRLTLRELPIERGDLSDQGHVEFNRCCIKRPQTGPERYDVLTDLNLTLSTRHRFDMNSSKSWSSESNRHSKA
jgi:hypothetical protein